MTRTALALRITWGMSLLLSGVAAGNAGAAELPPAAARPVEYARDVLPILRERCYACHDGRKQRGGLRLDLRAAAFKGGESYSPAIVPGQSAASPLVRIVAGLEEGVTMPPEGERLTAEQIGVLRAWIDQGANWPTSLAGEESVAHWAYQPIQRPPVPSAGDRAAVNPIDRFVAARLHDAQLTASPPADRATLIRRLSLDLWGLPPAPADVAEFVADPRPDAYEQLVERCLASPHYGERWARHWLDVVRFAESHGFEMNQARPNAWPYRDYVIRAFNADIPYDRFVAEQLAGDVLGVDEATGFLVGGPWDQVKSPDPGLTLQQRADELHDMVSTTGSTFLGLTVGCARCHNHKFDPISQTDYHALKAVFAGVQHGERAVRPPDQEARQQRARELRQRLAALEAQLALAEPLAHPVRTLLLDDDTPEGAAPDAPSVTQLVPRLGLEPHRPGTERGQQQDSGDWGRLPNLGRNYSYWNKVAGRDVFAWNPRIAGEFAVWVSWGCGWSTHAPDARYVFDRDGDLATRDDQREIARVDQRRFADGSERIPEQPLWSGLHFAGTCEFTPASRIVLRGGDTDAYVTADLLVLQQLSGADGAVASRVERSPGLRAPVSSRTNVERFPPVTAQYVRMTIAETTGSQPCIDELEVFTAAQPPQNVALAAAGAQATASSSLPGHEIHQLEHVHDGKYGNSRSWISNESNRGWVQVQFAEPHVIDRVVWSRDRDDQPPHFTDRTATQYRIEVSVDGQQWRTVASSEDRVPRDWKLPANAVFADVAAADVAALRNARGDRSRWEEELKRVEAAPAVYAGKMGAPEPIQRLHRGDPLQPREPVPPGGLTEFGAQWRLPADAADAERRLALARWIVDPATALPARVIVNRLWQHHFGQGLVNTPSDFGRNGAPPSHPELLDWLAGELIAHQWSLKHIQRLIVTSATYQQSSTATAAGLRVDAGSRLLWRYPPRRLEAEALRDCVLAVCGNLDDRMGGSGFDLFEPNTNYVKVYTPKREFGPAEWRRMVYQSKPRMQLDDTFGAFDCPDAGQIAPKRTSSTTALQALNLLNSRFAVQQADLFAARLRREAGDDAREQVRRAYGLAFLRTPEEDEVAAATRLIAEHGLPAFCRAVLNANEFLYLF